MAVKAAQAELAADAAAERAGVLAADTIVWFSGRIYGKPRDLDEAAEFLRELGGRTHSVFTGVAYAGPDGEIRAEWALQGALTDRDAAENWMITAPLEYPADWEALLNMRETAENFL